MKYVLTAVPGPPRSQSFQIRSDFINRVMEITKAPQSLVMTFATKLEHMPGTELQFFDIRARVDTEVERITGL